MPFQQVDLRDSQGFARAAVSRNDMKSEIVPGGRAARGYDAARTIREDEVRLRTEIDNSQTPENIQARLIDALPTIVAQLPKPAELRAVTIGGRDSTTITGLLTELAAVVGALRTALTPPAN